MLQYSQTVEISPDGRLLLGAGKEGLPVWDLKTLRLQGVTVPLPGSEAVTISSNGTLINATPNAANELVYVIEHLDHTFSLLTPAEFFRRFGQ